MMSKNCQLIIGWWRHVWPNLLDSFVIPSIPKYSTLMSSLYFIITSHLVTGTDVPNLGMKNVISDIWPNRIDLWRHVWRNISGDILTKFHHCDVITGHLGNKALRTMRPCKTVIKGSRHVSLNRQYLTIPKIYPIIYFISSIVIPKKLSTHSGQSLYWFWVWW